MSVMLLLCIPIYSFPFILCLCTEMCFLSWFHVMKFLIYEFYYFPKRLPIVIGYYFFSLSCIPVVRVCTVMTKKVRASFNGFVQFTLRLLKGLFTSVMSDLLSRHIFLFLCFLIFSLFSTTIYYFVLCLW